MQYSHHCHCKGKYRHANRGKADAAIRSLMQRSPDDRKMTSYKCFYCGHWHIGHVRKTQWERMKA